MDCIKIKEKEQTFATSLRGTRERPVSIKRDNCWLLALWKEAEDNDDKKRRISKRCSFLVPKKIGLETRLGISELLDLEELLDSEELSEEDLNQGSKESDSAGQDLECNVVATQSTYPNGTAKNKDSIQPCIQPELKGIFRNDRRRSVSVSSVRFAAEKLREQELTFDGYGDGSYGDGNVQLQPNVRKGPRRRQTLGAFSTGSFRKKAIRRRKSVGIFLPSLSSDLEKLNASKDVEPSTKVDDYPREDDDEVGKDSTTEKAHQRKSLHQIRNASIISQGFEISWLADIGTRPEMDTLQPHVNRCLSHDDLDALKDNPVPLLQKRSFDSEIIRDPVSFDPWDDQEDMLILGTSADDTEALPHVLSPPLMESLQQFLPFALTEDNYYLKFSLVRDGSSLHAMLDKVRTSSHCILALETSDGEVFGAFTSTKWKIQHGYFGNGEAFLWSMRRSRLIPCGSLEEEVQREGEIDVFPFTGENYMVQFCNSNKLGLGGGSLLLDSNESSFGLAIDDDLLHGTSGSSSTFGNRPLSKSKGVKEPFEIVNLEVWTLTPCMDEQSADQLEFFLDFREKNTISSQ